MCTMTISPVLPIRGVVFDLDGTLVRQNLDFEAIRREIGLPPGTPLLEALEQLPAAEQDRAWPVLDRHELAAASGAEVLPGVPEVLAWLDSRNVRRAVLTRNSRAASLKGWASWTICAANVLTKMTAQRAHKSGLLGHLGHLGHLAIAVRRVL
jgi:beta-phosphoglucomutase-like phosphatase (HAD superfamily)